MYEVGGRTEGSPYLQLGSDQIIVDVYKNGRPVPHLYKRQIRWGDRERERERERESQLLALIVLTSGVRGVARADRVVRRLVAYVREHDIPRNLIAAATQATPKTYSREK